MQGGNHRIEIDDVFQHLGADDGVVRGGVRRRVQIGNQREVNARQVSQACAAVVHLLTVEIGADGDGGRIARLVKQGEQRAVAAAVVEQPAAAERTHERERGAEAALVAERDQPVAAVDLLCRVVAVADGGQNFRSRVSHVPLKEIQNDKAIKRTSSRNDRRWMYSRSKRNFWRRVMSRGA